MTRLLVFLLRFRSDTRAAGAVEFALIAPLILGLYIGAVDLTRVVVFSQKMQNATVAVNDLVTQAPSLTRSEVETIFTAADTILARYRQNAIGIRVTAFQVDADGSAEAEWSVSRGMTDVAETEYDPGENLTGLGDYTLVVTETAYDFVPLVATIFQSSFSLSAEARGRFRGRRAVLCSDCTT